MILFMMMLGIGVGWAANWLADYLPRFSENSPTYKTPSPALRPPALWSALAIRRRQAVTLALGAEMLSAAFWGYLGMRALAMGFTAELWLLGGAFACLLVIALIDLKIRLVLNIMIYPAIVLALVMRLFMARETLLPGLIGALLAFGVFYFTALLRPGDLGGGDVKLAGLLGLVFGFPGILWTLIVGTGLGGIVISLLSLTHMCESKFFIPYAPFLCIGAITSLLYNPFLNLL